VGGHVAMARPGRMAARARVNRANRGAGCLNIVAALRPMPRARWQCLKISGAGQLQTAAKGVSSGSSSIADVRTASDEVTTATAKLGTAFAQGGCIGGDTDWPVLELLRTREPRAPGGHGDRAPLRQQAVMGESGGRVRRRGEQVTDGYAGA
jgi:hypothetical protein